MQPTPYPGVPPARLYNARNFSVGPAILAPRTIHIARLRHDPPCGAELTAARVRRHKSGQAGGNPNVTASSCRTTTAALPTARSELFALISREIYLPSGFPLFRGASWDFDLERLQIQHVEGEVHRRDLGTKAPPARRPPNPRRRIYCPPPWVSSVLHDTDARNFTVLADQGEPATQPR